MSKDIEEKAAEVVDEMMPMGESVNETGEPEERTIQIPLGRWTESPFTLTLQFGRANTMSTNRALTRRLRPPRTGGRSSMLTRASESSTKNSFATWRRSHLMTSPRALGETPCRDTMRVWHLHQGILRC